MKGKELWGKQLEYVNAQNKELVLLSYLVGEMEDDFKWFLFSLS